MCVWGGGVNKKGGLLCALNPIILSCPTSVIIHVATHIKKIIDLPLQPLCQSANHFLIPI